VQSGLFAKRLLRPCVVLFAVVTLVLGAPAGATFAAPSDPDGSGTLEQQITEVAKQYADAKSRLDAAVLKQAQLSAALTSTNLNLARLSAAVSQIAAATYMAGGVNTFNVLTASSSPEDLLDRLTSVHMFVEEQSIVLADLKNTQKQAAAQRDAMAQEVAVARNQTAQLQAQENKLRALLNNASGGPAGVVIPAPTAQAAPRNSDGTFPAQSCDQNDPTTNGCLTARTLHMYNEVKKAGFDHYVSCWRQQSWGEHPKGRACDWAAAKSGFANVAASGSDYTYGARLTGWLIGNSDRLGVLYVIWYKQIWLPGIGWHKYTTEGGNPAGDHTNHVHVSMR